MTPVWGNLTQDPGQGLSGATTTVTTRKTAPAAAAGAPPPETARTEPVVTRRVVKREEVATTGPPTATRSRKPESPPVIDLFIGDDATLGRAPLPQEGAPVLRDSW